MKLQTLTITGVVLILTSLILMLAGPRFWPAAFLGDANYNGQGGMMSGQGGMMSGQDGMMSGQGGMMSGQGGMMSGQGGMMSGQDGMMSGQGGMMSGQGGMMSGGMMGTMMASPNVMQSMMSGEVLGDPALPFDLRFLDQMIPHHQMAVHSAQAMIANSERAELRDLAQRIITAQQQEIEQMLAWRSQWFPDAAAAPSLTMMMDGGMMNGGMMGNQAQSDRLFLEMMIPHHEAAIEMAKQVLAESERPELHALADAIISSQSAEIDEMRGYLRDFYGVAP